MMAARNSSTAIPIVFLKNKSQKKDSYKDHFRSIEDFHFAPYFIPVLNHGIVSENVSKIRELLTSHAINLKNPNGGHPERYGGIIFTSQRAVEAFSEAIDGLPSLSTLIGPETPFYVVGPATADALRAIVSDVPIIGQDTGTGELLSERILLDFNSRWENLLDKIGSKPPLLFLTGNRTRGIIPKLLQAPKLSEERRIGIHGLMVYETSENAGFGKAFSTMWTQSKDVGQPLQWVVVFSPSGCKSMLDALGKLSGDGKVRDTSGQIPNIATIGPTTRDYLVREFGLEPTVVAAEPSPAGVASSILKYINEAEITSELGHE